MDIFESSINLFIYSTHLYSSNHLLNIYGFLWAENEEEKVWQPEHKQIQFESSRLTDFAFLQII
jgi:hypothetical protein